MGGFTRKSLADYLDSYDDEISQLQDSKREMLADYRQQLADAGMGKAQIKAEVEALKAAMRRRRAIAKKGDEAIEEADALADEIFVEITARAPRATRVANGVPVQVTTPKSSNSMASSAETVDLGTATHDPEPGEITEHEQPETATQSAEVSRVGGISSAQGKTEPLTSASAENVSDEISAPIPDDDVPAFLKKDMPRKTAADYRPHCQHPEVCAASGLQHCYSCSKLIAARESEVA